MSSILEKKLFDRVLKFISFLPMVAYWRGIWDLHFYYFSFLPEPINYWAIVAVGSFFIAAYFLYPLIHKLTKELSSFKKGIIARLTLFIGSIFLMGYWRGVWGVADYYLKDFTYHAFLLLFLSNYIGLTLLATSRSLIFPPFVVSMDNRLDALVPSTAFQVKPKKTIKSWMLYALDSLFTHFIVIPMVILTWNGGINLFDRVLPNTLFRNISYLFLGSILSVMIYLLEIPICLMASKLSNVNFSSVYFELSFTKVEPLPQDLEWNENYKNKPYLDFKYVETIRDEKNLKNKLLLKLKVEKNKIKPKSNGSENVQNGTDDSFQKPLIKQQYISKILKKEAVDSNIKKHKSPHQQQNLKDVVSENKSISQEFVFNASDKCKVLILEDILGVFVFLPMLLMWLGLWEINIELFKLGEPIDAWVNFITGTIVLFATGLLSFGGTCGCAHDLPPLLKSSFIKTLSSSIKPSISPTLNESPKL